MIGGWVGLHLLYLSWEDAKDRQISITVVAELGITGMVYCMLTANRPCLLPGFLLLLAGLLSAEAIGYGDGWLVLALGMWLDAQTLFLMLFLGMLLGIGFALSFQRREIPFVPFLGLAYILKEII